MDGPLLAVWFVRLVFLALIYVFLYAVARVLLRDLRAAAAEARSPLGRLVVMASAGEPPSGAVFPLDAVMSIGRDVNNAIVCDDPFASGEHAVLTYRGRSWYVEDLGSTNGTYVNGVLVEGIAPLGYGDELVVGQARFRIERSRR